MITHRPSDYVRVGVIVPSRLAEAYKLTGWQWWCDDAHTMITPTAAQIEKVISDLRSQSNATNRRAMRGGICVEFKNNTKTTLVHKLLHEKY